MPRWELRAELWKKLLPKQVPVADGIDYTELGKWLVMYCSYMGMFMTYSLPHTCTHTCTCIHTRICTHTHTCTCTRTHTPHSYELTGGEIARALCSAAEEVAMETAGPTHLTQDHLTRAAEAEQSRRQRSTVELSIFR